MPQPPIKKFIIPAFLACSALICAPVGAETLEQLDALSDRSSDEVSGIAMAREQAAQNEYLEALATLERVLAVFPKSHEARLIHAVLLCEIDDTQGGLVEISNLKKKHYGEQLLDEARARCQSPSRSAQ